jgi:hypothetical protein
LSGPAFRRDIAARSSKPLAEPLLLGSRSTRTTFTNGHVDVDDDQLPLFAETS